MLWLTCFESKSLLHYGLFGLAQCDFAPHNILFPQSQSYIFLTAPFFPVHHGVLMNIYPALFVLESMNRQSNSANCDTCTNFQQGSKYPGQFSVWFEGSRVCYGLSKIIQPLLTIFYVQEFSYTYLPHLKMTMIIWQKRKHPPKVWIGICGPRISWIV